MKRQDTLRTRDILQSMKSHGFDNVDDMAFESVTPESYLYYLEHIGLFGLFVALLGYIVSQAFDVWSRVWLADWASKVRNSSNKILTTF
jgi:hypothetical protein